MKVSAWRKASALVAVGLVALIGSVTAGLAAPAAKTAPDKNIVETAIAAGQFKTLASLLQATGLADTLATGGPFTVFAPTDEAFAKVPQATLDALAKDPAMLKSVLLYHVTQGSVPSSEVVKLTSAQTLNGAKVSIRVQNGSVYIDNAKVITPDVMASNGVIHVIDTVIIPKAASDEPKQNIVQTAVAAGQFKTLVSLVKKAGLAGALSGPGPLTVFAPTDAAFAKVPKATLAGLAKDKAKLKAVLLYHVAKGKLTADKVVKVKSIKTLQGSKVTVAVKGSNVFINKSKVITHDAMASNGVIHVVNAVLIPPAS